MKTRPLILPASDRNPHRLADRYLVTADGVIFHRHDRKVVIPRLWEGRPWALGNPISRIVASTFLRPVEKGEEVDHVNGKPRDNRVENLRILSARQHRVLHGRANPSLIEYDENVIVLAALLLRDGADDDKVCVLSGISFRHVRHLRRADRRVRIVAPILSGQLDFWNYETPPPAA